MIKIKIDYKKMIAHIYDFKDENIFKEHDLNILGLINLKDNEDLEKLILKALRKNIFRLADNTEHVLFKGDKIKTITECSNEDNSTHLAWNLENIPTNTELVIDDIINDDCIKTFYNGNCYYIKPYDTILCF